MYQTAGFNNRLTKWMASQKWFRSPWLSGGLVFLMNALYFGLTILILYLLMLIHIPYIHLIVMLSAVIVSILSWVTVGSSYEGTKRSRYKLGTLGSSFYLIMFLIFLYMYINIEPSYPGEDTFMAAIGLIMAMIVTVVATIICFVCVSFRRE